jgi:hypothetical protein
VAFHSFNGEESPADDYVFAGLIGLSDPLRPGVAELLRALRRGGVQPVMMTGDQRMTAAAVPRTLGPGNGDLRILDCDAISDLEGMADRA